MRPKLQISRGFTLIELMIVVAILAILAAVAIVAYGQYIKRARNSEATSILSDIRIKQEAYRATFHQYANITATEFVPTGAPSSGVVDLAWPTAGDLDSVPGRWRLLGVTPDRSVYFGYVCAAGPPGDGAEATGTLSAVSEDMEELNDFWFAAQALQDFDADGKCEGFEIYNGKGKIVKLEVGFGGWNGDCGGGG